MDHKKMKDLILVFEDLNQDEKAAAEAHLLECESCRELLEKIQMVEQTDSPWSKLPTDPSGDNQPLSGLESREIQAAEESRRLLVEKIRSRPVKTGAGSTENKWWNGNTGLFGFALAACLALFVWMPWQNNPDSFVQDFRVTTPAVVRGENSDLMAGDAFVVRFQVTESGWPVVVRIDDDASPELLFPNSNDPALEMAAGRAVVLPPPGSRSVWTVSSENAGSVFLISINENQKPDLQHLKAMMKKISSTVSAAQVMKAEFGNCTVIGQ